MIVSPFVLGKKTICISCCSKLPSVSHILSKANDSCPGSSSSSSCGHLSILIREWKMAGNGPGFPDFIGLGIGPKTQIHDRGEYAPPHRGLP